MKAVSAVVAFMMLSGCLLQFSFFAQEGSAERTWTQTSDTDFGYGLRSFCIVNGTGDAGQVELSRGGFWRQVNTRWGPPQREGFAYASSPATNETIVFGGYLEGWNTQIYYNDTWTFNISNDKWTCQPINGSPPSRVYSSMASTNSSEVVVFGGSHKGGGFYNDTWIFNATSHAWSNMQPKNAPPLAQEDGMACFSTDDKILLYGPYMINQTWIYDLSDNNWTKKTPPKHPPRISCPSIHPVFNDDKLVLYGSGYTEPWVYDLSDNQWYQKNASAIYYGDLSCMAPVYNDDKFVAYDIETERTWVYDLSEDKWYDNGIVGGPPDGLKSTRMASVPGDDKVVAYDGSGSNFVYDLSENRWSRMAPHTPPARAGHTMVAIRNTDRILLFGGYDSGDDSGWYPNDTWIYDFGDDRWYQQFPALAPGGRDCFGMAPVDGNDTVVLFGGRDATSTFNDTWVYNLTTNQWNVRNPSGSPPASYGHTLSPVTGDDKVMLFGGYRPGSYSYSNDTWIYDVSDNAWSNISSMPSPMARYCHAVATSLNGTKTVLFGGWSENHYASFTWQFNSTDRKWYKQTPSTSPAARYRHAMARAGNADKVILFHGDCDWLEDLTWIYNFTDNEWYSTTTPTVPHWRIFNAIATINFQDKVMLFGGYASTSDPYLSDTWVFDTDRFMDRGDYIYYNDTGGPSAFKSLFWNATTGPSTSVRFQLRGANSSANLSSFQFTGPDGSPSTYYETSGTPTWSGLNGSRWIQYKAYLRSDDEEATPALNDVSIVYNRLPDRPVPTAVANDTWTNSSKPTFSWIFTDNDSAVQSAFQWQADNASSFSSVDYDSGVVAAGGSSHTPAQPIADGIWNWRVRARDGEGGWSNFSDRWVVKVDTMPPQPFAPSANPAGWTSADPVIYFCTTDNTSGVDRYEVSLDGGGPFCASSPCTLTNLLDGQHSVAVTAHDRAGNKAGGNVTVRVDRSAPTPPNPRTVPADWTGTDAQVHFSSTDACSGLDHYSIRIDSGPPAAATSPWNLTGLSEGRHKISVTAFDMASNGASGECSIGVDRTPPAAFTPVIAPQGWTSSNPTVTFSTTDSHSGLRGYNVSVDGIALGGQQSPFALPPLPDGRHLVVVRASDRVGNWVEGTAWAFIDRSGPGWLQLRADPPGWTNRSPALIFSGLDNASSIGHFELSIDGGAFEQCTSPHQLPVLKDGIHTVTVRAVDWAGNSNETTISVFTDSTAPRILTLTASADGWSGQPVQVSFSASDSTSGIALCEIGIDGKGFSEQTSPFMVPESVPEGVHNITLRVHDAAGNRAQKNATVYIDRTAPRPFKAASDRAGWTNKTPVITFETFDNLSGLDHYEMSIDGGPGAPCKSPRAFSTLDDGAHNITIIAQDRAGNCQCATVTVLLDRTPPDDFTPLANSTGWSRTPLTVRFVTNDSASGVAGYDASLDNCNYSRRTSPLVLQGLSDGTHTVFVRATDNAGNSRVGECRVLIDNSPPTGLSVSINGGKTSAGSRAVRLSLSADDPGSGTAQMAFCNDSGDYTEWEPFTTGRDWMLSGGAGAKTVHFKVRDAAGNEAAAVSAQITLRTGSGGSAAAFPWMAPAAALAVAAAAAAFLWMRRKKSA